MSYKPWTLCRAHKRIKETTEYNRPWLILERLGLADMPVEVFDLAHLDELIVIDNLLVSIPAEIKRLKNLTRLCLFYNEISELPAEIGKLVNLTHLDLSCNKLNNLPPEIANLKNLKYLDLRFNELPIPEEVLEKVYEPQKIIEAYLAQLQPVQEDK